MKIHHLGYAVYDVAKSIEAFATLGFQQTSDITFDEIRGVNIAFMKTETK